MINQIGSLECNQMVVDLFRDTKINFINIEMQNVQKTIRWGLDGYRVFWFRLESID